MKMKVSDYLDYENLQLRKLQTIENHRRFTLRCYKVGITPISCKIRNPLKTSKSFKIIHIAEKTVTI